MYSGAYIRVHLGTTCCSGFVERLGVLRIYTYNRDGQPCGLSESGDVFNGEHSIAGGERR